MTSRRAPARIVVLATSVEFGGIERVLLNLFQYMDGDVELMPIIFTRTDLREASFLDRLRTLGVRYEPIYMDSVTPIAADTVNLSRLLRVLRKRQFDLIHSHGYRADVFALAASRWFKVPSVATCHGFTPTNRRLRFYHALDARALRRFTRVIAVSARMKDELVGYGVDESRIRVIINAVADVSPGERLRTRTEVRAAAGYRDDEFVFGYVGRLSPEKGVEYLIDAFVAANSRDSWRLLVVGDGPGRSSLEQYVKDRGVSQRVTFTGFQSETARWYGAMDAFVLPSLTEGTPMALLEAMAHRVPVAATRVGGVPAVVEHGENGLLVPPADVQALAEAMQTIATTPALRDRLSEAGARSVRQSYDVRRWVRDVRDVYAEALENRTAC